MLAAMHGRTECVRRLLDAGANVRHYTHQLFVIWIDCSWSSINNGVTVCLGGGFADPDVRFVARADVPALRGVLRPLRLPPDHPLGGPHRARVAVLVGLLLGAPQSPAVSADRARLC